MDPDDELERMIARHLAYQPTIEPLRMVRDRLQRLLSPIGGSGGPGEVGEDTIQMLAALGLDGAALGEATQSLARARELGIDVRDLLPIMQAYVRGIGRIADAEATLLRTLLREQPEDERFAYLDQLFTDLLPLVPRAFEVAHASLLGATLHEELTPELFEEDGSPILCAALIDLCGSTRYLRDTGDAEVQQLVDALFETGQACTLNHHVRVWKYVGDGMFLVARDVEEMVRACFAALEQIEATLPLPARAGIAAGPLLRRSGDYFGFGVNVSQLLTKVARPGEVLATAETAAQLPAERRGRARRHRIRGWDERLDVVPLRP